MKDVEPNLYKISKRKNRIIASVVTNDNWIRDLRDDITTNLNVEFTNLWALVSPTILQNGMSYVFKWRFTPDGIYIANSAYNLQCQGMILSPFGNLIWKPWAPAKCKFFAWLATKDKILIADRLMAWMAQQLFLSIVCTQSGNSCTFVHPMHLLDSGLDGDGSLGRSKRPTPNQLVKTGTSFHLVH